MKNLSICLLMAGLFTVGCKGADSTPTRPARETKPSANTKGDPKEILAALRQLGAAFHKYEEAHGRMPAAAILGKESKPLLSWRVALLPLIKQANLYKQFKLDEPWDSEHNRRLLAQMPKVYMPLRGAATKARHSTCYQVFTGPVAPFSLQAKVGPKVTDFKDGTAQTFLIVEASEAVPWTKPADLVYDAKKPLPKLGFGDRVYLVLGDGSAHFIKKTVPEATFRAAITPNGQERDILLSDERSVLDKE
jgi:hypothetical protein